ncbi:MAG: DUF839 domain-containing protein [Aureliella sp.]
MSNASRRGFMQQLASTVSAGMIVGSFDQFAGRAAAGEGKVAGFGPLRPTIDDSTGRELLSLSDGFRYQSFGWTNQPMDDGTPTPDSHDGMAVIDEQDGIVTLCRNHEVGDPLAADSGRNEAYDRFAGGGCSNLQFDRNQEKWISSKLSLAGTAKNCAGGATPWNSWLSCEETVDDPQAELEDVLKNTFTQPHGFVFDVPISGVAGTPKPIESLGRFVHEAVAIDPESGTVYLTEDRGTAGLYRMVPDAPGDLHRGGKFQMLACERTSDLRKGLASGFSADVHWVDIDDRLRAHSPGTVDCLGVYSQGKAKGGLTFARLEGCCVHGGHVFVTATSGGDSESGQVWKLDPRENRLSLVFESPGSKVLDMPDNMTVSPRGGILLCEDGDYVPQRLQVLTEDGTLFPFAANNMQLDGLHGHKGDFRGSEWAGATFTADGEWLFVNLQTPGVTFAITGPWRKGLI